MHDRGKVLTGIAIFLIVVLLPVWFSAASGGGERPDLTEALGKAEGRECVADADWMRAHHMELLDRWRDEVVRDGDRSPIELGAGGNAKKWPKSLTRTCIGCHGSRENFCMKCHDYVGVEPDCWDCHVVPGED